MKAQILIVEDDSELLELLEYRLNKEGYAVLGFLSTKNVKRAIEEENIDLILMDRNLPGVEGSEFIAMQRDQGMDIPVIFLSAKDNNFQKEEGFLRGGDDYITKPFEMTDLLLRINAVLRRTKVHHHQESTEFRDILLNLKSRTVTISDKEIELTKLEFDLLHTLIAHKGSVLKRDFLLKQVWGKTGGYQGRTVNVAINRLKEKIDPDKNKNYIKTIRGIGYSIH
jgi:DNA-binding response OmpR family regulator